MANLLFYVFRPNEESQICTNLPSSNRVPEWTYVYDAHQAHWYVRDTKQVRWLNILAEGVPEAYRLELLLLQTTYP